MYWLLCLPSPANHATARGFKDSLSVEIIAQAAE
jgi:hypothetical protein